VYWDQVFELGLKSQDPTPVELPKTSTGKLSRIDLLAHEQP